MLKAGGGFVGGYAPWPGKGAMSAKLCTQLQAHKPGTAGKERQEMRL